MQYSFIIPVYNRPDELDELLKSLAEQTYTADFEVVVIEDGSTISSESICQQYQSSLSIIWLNLIQVPVTRATMVCAVPSTTIFSF